ncbi:MAG: PH domain-containing protein [Actinomycetota bacterium]|nr:PH domain-containing protein [Actinomycetota bacterium]MDQ2957459.1 PH domain-containing protein [Actinomycetota bacterium]
MPYPEKLLAPEEEIVEHLHPHWLTLLPAVAAFIVICAAAGVGIAFLPNSNSNHSAHQILLLVVIVLALALLLWLTITPLIRWRSTHYVFTTHRVLIRRGVLKHVGRDITLGRISDVAYEQTLADRIFRAGTLHIESAGENGQETLVNIPRANDVQQTLNRLIEADSSRRGQWQPGQHPGGYQPQTGE